MDQDDQYLKLLSIFHYVVAGLMALIGCIPIIHLVMGIAMVTGQLNQGGGGGQPPPPEFGWLFIGMAVFIMAWCWGLATGLCLAGHYLSQRRRYIFCMVMAAFACTFQPFGMVLGIFTILVLLKPGVKLQFAQGRPSPPVEIETQYRDTQRNYHL